MNGASWARKVRTLVLAFALVAAVVVGIELLLGATDLATAPPGQESELRYQRVYLPSFEPRTAPDGSAVLATADARHAFQWILQEKPAGALRIAVFGGSATAGLGTSPSATFARYLERMLRAAEPGRPIEVLNLGMVALPSAGVLHLVRDALATIEPDLVVVYAGNNEFLEIHSRKFFEAQASPLARARAALGRTNVARALRKLGGGAHRPSITSAAIAAGDRQVSHREMLKEVALSESERLAVLVDYERNLDAMCAAAQAAGVPIVLMTVSANWRWWGIDDFPAEDVPDSPGDGPAPDLPIPDQDVGLAPSAELQRELYGQALRLEREGSSIAAAYFRAALDADPHLRRATRAHASRVRAVAARNGVPVVDTDRVLLAGRRFGVVGFESFYDYVHFTPAGAARVAAALATEVERLELVGPVAAAVATVAAEIEAERTAALDAIDVGRFIGFADDPARLADRDLWKYDALQAELRAATDAGSTDPRVWIWRGNVAYFRLDGFAEAERAWTRAAELGDGDGPGPAANLRRLANDPRR